MQHLFDDWIDVIVLLLLQLLNVFLGFFEELKVRQPLIGRCAAAAPASHPAPLTPPAARPAPPSPR